MTPEQALSPYLYYEPGYVPGITGNPLDPSAVNHSLNPDGSKMISDGQSLISLLPPADRNAGVDYNGLGPNGSSLGYYGYQNPLTGQVTQQQDAANRLYWGMGTGSYNGGNVPYSVSQSIPFDYAAYQTNIRTNPGNELSTSALEQARRTGMIDSGYITSNYDPRTNSTSYGQASAAPEPLTPAQMYGAADTSGSTGWDPNSIHSGAQEVQGPGVGGYNGTTVGKINPWEIGMNSAQIAASRAGQPIPQTPQWAGYDRPYGARISQPGPGRQVSTPQVTQASGAWQPWMQEQANNFMRQNITPQQMVQNFQSLAQNTPSGGWGTNGGFAGIASAMNNGMMTSALNNYYGTNAPAQAPSAPTNATAPMTPPQLGANFFKPATNLGFSS